MESDGFQVKDFLEVLRPRAKAAFPNMKVSCCDATGARQERMVLGELLKINGRDLFDVGVRKPCYSRFEELRDQHPLTQTWHNHQSNPERPFNTVG